MSASATLRAALLMATALAVTSRADAPLTLRLVDLNLHGYHPMLEANRYWQDRATGKILKTIPALTYYTREEIDRGQRRQLAQLGASLTQLAPDLIFLQEVGAGLPESPKDCAEFARDGGPDVMGKNSALRIRARLNANGADYRAALGCRGNIGWQTYADTFRNGRVLKPVDQTGWATVYDYDANPYPQGFIVEGTAILVRAPWRIVEERTWREPLGASGESFFFQAARIRRDGDPRWLLAVNMHSIWNVRHFEAAMAVRRAVAAFIASHPERDTYAGLIMGGDMNASLYRPREGTGEACTVPWELARRGEFDFGPGAPAARFSSLETLLWRSNLDKQGRYSGELGTEAEAHARIRAAIENFQDFARSPSILDQPLREAVEDGDLGGRCALRTFAAWEPACRTKTRIDLIFVSPQIEVRSSAVLWSKSSFFSTADISDHPGVALDLATH